MPEIRTATDTDYDSTSRSIEEKLDIYLYGILRAPITVTRDNYLIDMDLLEEVSSDDKTPFGNVTANELTVSLLNTNGIFSPTNQASPYYGYMKRGVEVRKFIRPVGTSQYEYTWQPLGKFYITEWDATITSTVATLTAADKLYSVFELPDIKMPVMQGITFKTFYESVFSLLGITGTIDASLIRQLAMAYSVLPNKDLLTDMSIGALANCFCDHNGDVVVKSISSSRQLRATLTDANQIIDVDVMQDSNTAFSGAGITYSIPSESDPTELLNVPSLSIPVGTAHHETYNLATTPMIRLIYASLIGPVDAYVSGITSSSSTVTVDTTSLLAVPTELPLSIVGTTLSVTSGELSDGSENDLSIKSSYIQDAEYAAQYRALLHRYISSDTPVLTVQVRGNPLLNLGDKIRVISAKYHLDFTGIIIKQTLQYNGALSGTITLLSDTILEVT